MLLFGYEEGRSIVPGHNSCVFNGNIEQAGDKVPECIKYVYTFISDTDSSVIQIPSYVTLVPGEEFYMQVPEGYSYIATTSISYNRLSGSLYRENSIYNFPASKIGKYVRLRYSYGVTSNSREVISFHLVD